MKSYDSLRKVVKVDLAVGAAAAAVAGVPLDERVEVEEDQSELAL